MTYTKEEFIEHAAAFQHLPKNVPGGALKSEQNP